MIDSIAIPTGNQHSARCSFQLLSAHCVGLAAHVVKSLYSRYVLSAHKLPQGTFTLLSKWKMAKTARENKTNIYFGWPKETKTVFSAVGRINQGYIRPTHSDYTKRQLQYDTHVARFLFLFLTGVC